MFCNHNHQETPHEDDGCSISTCTFSSCDGKSNASNYIRQSIVEDFGGSEVDSILAQDLAKLSVQERELAQEDMHGLSPALQETDEMRQKGLDDLEKEIQAIKQKAAYDRALFLAPSYVKSDWLRLIALRSEQWNPRKAARKLVDIYQDKERVFGREVAARNIYFSDLDTDAQRALRAGAVFELGKDSAGRNVLCNSVVGFAECNSGLSVEQVRWYVSLHASSCAQENSKGTVVVSNMFGLSLVNAPTLIHLQIAHNNMVFPFRVAALHGCFGDARLKPLLRTILNVTPRQVRIRVQLHAGSPMEVLYALRSYGISQDVLPFDCNGKVRLGSIRGKLELVLLREKRRQLEEQQDEAVLGRIRRPNPTDVLLGRGYHYQNFSGNLYLRSIIQDRIYMYEMMRHNDKQLLSKSIVDELNAAGARFLKRERDVWVIADDRVATEKVCMLFRNQGRKRK